MRTKSTIVVCLAVCFAFVPAFGQKRIKNTGSEPFALVRSLAPTVLPWHISMWPQTNRCPLTLVETRWQGLVFIRRSRARILRPD